ncbi:MAG TPA: type II toxin-antitoxin system Phd/YefM family antitoxin [Desulfobacterales bacterium]|nr:MAG: type II toxin-antitoxin system Phd/YefM family antitoxin [Deltaproteobacteria bacterium]HHC23801.1 type II toxin-antitoxin system Phd/YefM family antitoxin [Desulfobacterales bacterium]
MLQINIREAETNFLQLITSVEKGEEIVIARHGRPVARILPVIQSASPRKPGSAKGKFRVPPEFFEPLPDEILNAFEQRIFYTPMPPFSGGMPIINAET